MILLLDTLINSYLNIFSCLIILLIINLNKYNFFGTIIIDILLNGFPIISLILLIIYSINKLIFYKLNKNKLNIFIMSIINMLLFISILFILNNYNFNYIYYIKENIFGIIFNIVIYFIYIFYK